MATTESYVTPDGDEIEFDSRSDGWYWRWTSNYAPDPYWHGPEASVEACVAAERRRAEEG